MLNFAQAQCLICFHMSAPLVTKVLLIVQIHERLQQHYTISRERLPDICKHACRSAARMHYLASKL